MQAKLLAVFQRIEEAGADPLAVLEGLSQGELTIVSKEFAEEALDAIEELNAQAGPAAPHNALDPSEELAEPSSEPSAQPAPSRAPRRRVASPNGAADEPDGASVR